MNLNTFETIEERQANKNWKRIMMQSWLRLPIYLQLGYLYFYKFYTLKIHLEENHCKCYEKSHSHVLARYRKKIKSKRLEQPL